MKIEEESGKKSEEKTIIPVQDNSELLLAMQEQINTLLADKEKDVAKGTDNETVAALKELVTQLKEKPDSEKYLGEDSYVKPEDIDPNDVLDIGVTFFSHQVGYVIADDKRNGHNVRTPFGRAIKFAYQATRQVKSGNETKLHNLSAFTSYSKMEVEWIMAHKFYGTIFFSTHTEALSTDARKATKLARIILVLQRYDVHKIITIAKGLGIPPSENIPVLRIAIANKQAEDELKAEEESNLVRVREAIIEKDILGEPVA